MLDQRRDEQRAILHQAEHRTILPWCASDRAEAASVRDAELTGRHDSAAPRRGYQRNATPSAGPLKFTDSILELDLKS